MSTISPFTRTVVEAMRTLFVSREDRFVQLRAKLTSPAIQRNTPIKALIIPAVRCLCLPSEYAYLAMAYHDQKLIKKKVLLASPLHPSQPRQRNSALLTIDLTTAVADEAIRRRASIIIAYRASHTGPVSIRFAS